MQGENIYVLSPALLSVIDNRDVQISRLMFDAEDIKRLVARK